MSQSGGPKHRLRGPLIGAVACGLFGCASTQLNYNTLNLARSLDELNSHQIYFNLEQIAIDEYATPSQAGIAAGTATTTNSISPTLMAPLGTATTVTSSLATAATNSVANAVTNGTTNTVANTLTSTTTGTQTNAVMSNPSGAVISSTNTVSTAVANATSNAVTNAGNSSTTNTATNGNTTTNTGTGAVTHGNKSLSLAFTDNWSQSWTLNPAADADELRRLRALYRYALGKTEVNIGAFKPGDTLDPGTKDKVNEYFMCEYPLQMAKATTGQATLSMQANQASNRAEALKSRVKLLDDDIERSNEALKEAQTELSEERGAEQVPRGNVGGTARARQKAA
jgi:hypothetical protein